MHKLSELVGQKAAALIPHIHPTEPQQIVLHAIEAAGIWIESQKLINSTYSALEITMHRNTLVFFFPWHQITWIMGSADVPSIADHALA